MIKENPTPASGLHTPMHTHKLTHVQTNTHHTHIQMQNNENIPTQKLCTNIHFSIIPNYQKKKSLKHSMNREVKCSIFVQQTINQQ